MLIQVVLGHPLTDEPTLVFLGESSIEEYDANTRLSPCHPQRRNVEM